MEMRAKEEQLLLRKTPAGVPVIVDKLSYSRSAAVAVYISVGSRDEEQDKCGIAHLLEHLMFKGTELYTSKEISELVEAAGGEMNGYTGKEVTCYFIQTIDETLATAEHLLAEMIRRPRLEKKDMDMEKKVVAQEIKMAEDEPEGYIHELLAKTAWQGNPMANSEGGSVECIMPLGPKDIQSFFEGNYRPPNLYVVATGNVDVDQVVSWASSAFDELPRSSHKLVRHPPVFHSGTKLYPREGDQLYAAMAFPGVAAPHPDRFVQSMLSVILGAGTSSRLYQKVREENGLVYSIYAMSAPYTDTGAFSIFFSTSAENSDKVFQLVASELRRLKDEGLEKGELARAKNWLKGMIVRKLEPMDNRMYFLGEQFLQTGNLMTEDQILQRMEAVTEEEVAGSAVDVLEVGKMCVALHTSKKDGKRVSRLLASLDL
jgi:predicted Zn-dependent peptidase